MSNTEKRKAKVKAAFKIAGEPTGHLVPDFENRSDSYVRDMMYCLNWYNINAEFAEMRQVCEKNAGQKISDAASMSLVKQLGSLIRMKENGAVFSPAHMQKIETLAADVIAVADKQTKTAPTRVDNAAIALAKLDAAFDEMVTTSVDAPVEIILSQFRFNREEKQRVSSYLARINEQMTESVTSKEPDVKEGWKNIPLKLRKRMVELTAPVAKKTRVTKQAKPAVKATKPAKTVLKDVVKINSDLVIAVNAKHGVVQMIKGDGMVMVGGIIIGHDPKRSFYFRMKDVENMSAADIQAASVNAKRLDQPVTGRLGQLWSIL